jgi:signal recognition particle subunit SRP54
MVGRGKGPLAGLFGGPGAPQVTPEMVEAMKNQGSLPQLPPGFPGAAGLPGGLPGLPSGLPGLGKLPGLPGNPFGKKK